MYIHYIILGSAYEEGCRIALDIVGKDSVNETSVKNVTNYLKHKCSWYSLSTHVIPNKGKSFSDIQEYDKYFEKVKLIKTKETFAKLVNKDKYIDGYDVARYIMTKIPCTHLKVQKLTYMCYAEYLCKNNERLFDDIIYAYEKGPVIKSVYDKLKKTKGKIIEDDTSAYSKEEKYLPIRSRILVTENGIDKVDIIDKTIEKYGKLSSNELVQITHRENSPWSKSGKGLQRFKKITDQVIKDYHKVEEI